jgi:hypothetical protein
MENMFEGMRLVVDPVVLAVGSESTTSQVIMGILLFGLLAIAVTSAAALIAMAVRK